MNDDLSVGPRGLAGAALAALAISLPVHAELYYEISGNFGLEGRFFQDDPAFAGQSRRDGTSLSFSPELYWEWGDGVHSLRFAPFLRVDSEDDERTHNDVRELLYLHAGDSTEFQAGIGKVFWGVTEFQNPVDVINQTDSVEDFTGDAKLGQPLLSLAFIRDWGVVDVMVLPGFRERTFPGASGRLRSQLVVDTDAATFESDDGEDHIDYALRWSHSVGVFDLGVHAFSGTNRSPTLQPVITGTTPTALAPFYPQMDQVGVDVQATIDAWLLKGEFVTREQQSERFNLAQLGVEYSFYSLADGLYDLGLLLEIGWDERGTDATDNLFQDDIGVGLRFGFNDEASSEMLIGVIEDQDFDSRSFQLEASTRIGDSWRVAVDVRAVDADDPNDPLTSFAADDHVQLRLERFF
ncbi:MAG: hypothetical protein AAF460_04925 [Pseudomonadota bacterium]